MFERRTLLAGMLAAPLAPAALAAVAETSNYVPETDPLARRKIDQWQDRKFGFMMHWGAYSQWGVVESWSICSEDEPWEQRPEGIAYVDYVRQYEKLPQTFNPVDFDPEGWAATAKAAGMKYVVFTTKHHDGFSMFDTRQTDYRITAPNVPFHTNSRANVAKHVFDAFRAQGFGIGAYFSKPDWHSDFYWWRRFATPNRHVNYDTAKYPRRWQAFRDFTYRQIEELMTGYGSVDVLWLDGGWVHPGNTLKDINGRLPGVPWSQDIDMPRIVAMARRNQPGLIVVDRAVGGRFENYRTPEQTVPEKPLAYPWETCMTLGDSWSYKPADKYKSARTIVHLLADIAAKGGNLLLNVGPDALGRLPTEAMSRMREIGAWMDVNGRAIYASRAIEPSIDGKLRFTRLRDGTAFAIRLADEDERMIPETLTIHGLVPAPGAQVHVLGSRTPLPWLRQRNSTVISVPAVVRNQTAGALAWSIELPGAAPSA